MKIMRLAAWAGLLATTPLSSAASVRRLTAGTFESAVADKGDLLVMFYKPGCAPCKDLLPEFEAAADELKNVRFAKLNAADNAAIAQRYGVKGLPELRYFKEREPQAIDGSAAGRTKGEIVAWAEKIATAPDRIVELSTVAAIEEFVQSTSGTVSVVGVFESAEHAEMFVAFATSFRYPVRFGWVTTAAVDGARAALSLEASEPNVAVLFKPFDEPRVEFVLKEPLEGSKKSRSGLVDIMEKMMGVPPAEAAKLVIFKYFFDSSTSGPLLRAFASHSKDLSSIPRQRFFFLLFYLFYFFSLSHFFVFFCSCFFFPFLLCGFPLSFFSSLHFLLFF